MCFAFPGFLSIYEVLVLPKSFGHILNYNAGQVEYFPNPHHKAQKILATRTERKTLFGRHNQKWEGSIKIYLKEMGNKNVVWIHMAHDMVQWQTPSQSVRSQISIYFLCHFPQQLHIVQFICSAIHVMPQRMWLTTAALWPVSSVHSRNSSTVRGSSVEEPAKLPSACSTELPKCDLNTHHELCKHKYFISPSWITSVILKFYILRKTEFRIVIK